MISFVTRMRPTDATMQLGAVALSTAILCWVSEPADRGDPTGDHLRPDKAFSRAEAETITACARCIQEEPADTY